MFLFQLFQYKNKSTNKQRKSHKNKSEGLVKRKSKRRAPEPENEKFYAYMSLTICSSNLKVNDTIRNSTTDDVYYDAK